MSYLQGVIDHMKTKFLIIKRYWNKIAKKELEISSDFSLSKDDDEIRIGEVIDHRLDKNGCETLTGDSIIIRNKSDRLEIVGDKLGFQWMYFHNNKDFGIISSNFWEVLKNLERFSFNKYEFLSSIFSAKSKIFNDTFINEIKILPPGSKLIMRSDGSFKVINCFDLKYTGEVTSEKKAAKELYEAIDEWIKRLIERYENRNVITGISGGWDSRLIPHFILKYKDPREVHGFIIGESRPRRFFLSFDHRLAYKIADFYNIDISHWDFDKDSIWDKVTLDVYSNPLKTSNILKTVVVEQKLLDTSLLISGGNGVIVGGHVINEKVNEMNTEELIDFMTKKFTYVYYRPQGISRRINSAMHYLLGSKYKYDFSYIVPKWWMKTFKEQLYGYIESNSEKKSFSEILMWYHLNIASKVGAFESLNNQVEAFSIYYPIVFEKTLRWNINLLIGRKVLREMVIEYIPDLSKIPGQNLSLPLTTKSKKLTMLKQLSELLIRGIGLDYFRWAKWKEYEMLVKAVSQSRNDYFEDVLNIKTSLLPEISRDPHISFWAKRNIIKFKIVLDVITSGNYKYIGESDFNERLLRMYKL